MNSDKCVAEFKRLSDVSSMTQLSKLITVRSVDHSEFGEWARKCMPLKDSIRLAKILAAGSYKSAMSLLCIEYEDCYWFVAHCYEAFEQSLELCNGYVNPEVAFEFLVSLQLGGDQLSVMRRLREYDKEYFEYLTSLTRIKPKTLGNVMEYVKMDSILEIANVFGITEMAARNAVAKLYKALYVAAGDVQLPREMACFLEQVEELDVRSRNVLLHHRCKSREDVEKLMAQNISGFGATSKVRVRKWLQVYKDDKH